MAPRRPTYIPGIGRIYTADELAAALGCTRDWLWRQCRGENPTLTHIRIGRDIRFREEDISHLLDSVLVRGRDGD